MKTSDQEKRPDGGGTPEDAAASPLWHRLVRLHRELIATTTGSPPAQVKPRVVPPGTVYLPASRFEHPAGWVPATPSRIAAGIGPAGAGEPAAEPAAPAMAPPPAPPEPPAPLGIFARLESYDQGWPAAMPEPFRRLLQQSKR